jgi:hypothetical protein
MMLRVVRLGVGMATVSVAALWVLLAVRKVQDASDRAH